MTARLKLLLFFLSLLASFSSVFAQDFLNKKIFLENTSSTVYTILSILKDSNLSVAFSKSKISDSPITLKSNSESVKSILDDLRNQANIDYTINNNLILFSSRTANNPIHTIRGIVTDQESGEVLIGATVIDLKSKQGVITNNYGYYSFSSSDDFLIIQTDFIGFKNQLDTVQLGDFNTQYNIQLKPEVGKLEEVVISAKSANNNITSVIPGYNTINLKTEGQIPYFLGEVDVLQGAILLPGIRTLGEDANGLNIRGGEIDQNLILLDEATIYNPNHLYGLISIFNPEAVNHIEVMKGFIPPSYGGRASSVITVHQKEGDYNKYQVNGGLGILSGKVLVQGPLKKQKSSFILSGRRSLFNLPIEDDTNIRFHDLNTKINWKMNNKNTFFLSGYFGNDRNTNIFETERNWGNRNITMRWNHLYGKKVFSNTSAIFSEYNYKITQPREAASFIGTSKVINYTLKSDWTYTFDPIHELNFGLNLVNHKLRPGERVPFNDSTSSANTIILESERGLESALYLCHKINYKKLKMLYGLRASSLHVFGPYTEYLYDERRTKSDETILDTISFKSGEKVQSYYNLEPRISLNYLFRNNRSVKVSYTRSVQYLHLISNTITPAPTDIWKLSDPFVKPTISDHFSLGLYANFFNNEYEVFLDGYYKNMQNLLDYKDGAELLFNSNPETELLNGVGRSYGLEFFAKKNEGKFTGWISYTLSRSEIQVDGRFQEEKVNNGRFFPTNHDKRHDLSVVGIYQFTPRVSSSLSFNYSTGRPYTLPIGKYTYEDKLVPHFGERNQYRLPAYHRLDFSLKIEGKKHKTDGSERKFQDYWTLVAYNVYGRDNVYSYVFEQNESTGVTSIIPYSIFDTIIPGITYNFKF